jgi:hypothetical protein
MFGYLEHSVVNYDRFYTKLSEFNISSGSAATLLNVNATPGGGFKLDKLLVQLGHVGKVVLPTISLDHQPNLVVDYNRMQARTFARNSHRKHSLMEKCHIEQDRNAEALALKYKCSVVSTQSALVALIYQLTVQNDEDFKLPFCVRLRPNGEKCVILEKQLVGKKLSKRERNEKFYKKALGVSFVKPQVAHHQNSSQNESSTRQPRSLILPDNSTVDYDLISDLDSFGTNTSSGSAAARRRVKFELDESSEKKVAVAEAAKKDEVDVTQIGRSATTPIVSSIFKRARPASMDNPENHLTGGEKSGNKAAKKLKTEEKENGSDEDYDEYDEDDSEGQDDLVIADLSETENKINVSIFFSNETFQRVRIESD